MNYKNTLKKKNKLFGILIPKILRGIYFRI